MREHRVTLNTLLSVGRISPGNIGQPHAPAKTPTAELLIRLLILDGHVGVVPAVIIAVALRDYWRGERRVCHHEPR